MKKHLKNSDFLCVGIILALMLTLVLGLFAFGPQEEEQVTDAIKRENDSSIYNFLVLGRDRVAGLCDVIILASINTDNGNISFMQIPRDTYFNSTEATYKKINGAYNSLGSSAAFRDALASALGIEIDYYLSLGLDTVSQMVDAISGIEVNIPTDMDYNDPEQNLSIHLKAGKQTLNGESAVQFIRYRSGYVTGDLGRIDAQKLFLNAFANKIADIGNPFALYNVFKLICTKGETNIKEKDLISIGIKCMKTKGGTLSYMTAPGEAIQSEKSGAWYYILSSSSMSDVLESRFDKKENFDKDNKFVDKSNKSFYDIYNKNCDIKIYTADDIENNKININ